jgi:hypothetical protein
VPNDFKIIFETLLPISRNLSISSSNHPSDYPQVSCTLLLPNLDLYTLPIYYTYAIYTEY